jgi:hypothetical protein
MRGNVLTPVGNKRPAAGRPQSVVIDMINVNVKKQIMGSVLRIALTNMLVLFRLAMVASLVLYTLPTATFAMHGGNSSSVVVNLDDTLADHASMDVSDHHDHGVAKETAKKDQKQDKPNCCTDFCISFAILAEEPAIVAPVQDSVRLHFDELSVLGQLSSLHRPPSIRA